MVKIIELSSSKLLMSMSEAKKYIPIIKRKEQMYITSIGRNVEVVDDKYITYLLKSESVKHTVFYVEIFD